MKRTLPLCWIVSLVLAACAPSRPYTIPAHWTGSTDKVEPVVEDFSFEALDFATSDNGWIVGYRFFLHLEGDRLTRTYVNPHKASFDAVDSVSAVEAWAGGSRTDGSELHEPTIWHFKDGAWSEVELNLPEARHCGVYDLHFASPQEGWAICWCDPRIAEQRSLVLRFDGKVWRVDPYPHTNGRGWALFDLCLYGPGDGWAVGRRRAGDGPPQPLVVEIRDGNWHPVADVVSLPSRGILNRVWCLPDGSALASGIEGENVDGELIFMSHDESWRVLEVPEHLRNKRITAMGGPSLEDFWLALFAPSERTLLARVTDGRWTEMPAPVLPHGGFPGYVINDLQFVSETEGWAVAIDDEGPGLFRGIVFHYRDGVWRNRNWSWHFWDERGFGLSAR